jgi:AhpD family alkylhydroperoxidase
MKSFVEAVMEARMKNPVMTIPGAMQATLALSEAVKKGGVPERTLLLVQLRASQINGCSFCVDMHARDARKADETEQRLYAVGAWRDAPYFTPEERAALALTEAATRVQDSADPVPDAIWEEAKRHYGERELGTLVLAIAMINFWNRTNIPVKQVAGSWKG